MPPLRCANAPSTAKLFVQLYARSTSSSLDVLLPPRTQARALSLYPGAPRTSNPKAPISSRFGAVIRRQSVQTPRPVSRSSRRTFTSSRPLAKTLAIHNPQIDDDGNDMALEITPRAANRLSQIMTKDKNPYLALRIQVESGGCHGFQYLMSLTTLPSSSSPSPPEPEQVASEVTPSTTTKSSPSPPALGEDDTIFAFAQDGEGEGGGDAGESASSATPPLTSPKIILDLPSLELLKGSKVDYTMELIGSQFKIVDNPLATSSCGCGTSFDIKV
ncbi:hypothetical protein F4808DRAFT_428930 [Astrocystis sublimbata]|nr:hypothetical protein F4808DRAFT_428930 [Astrocystis sublimbata]